MVRKHLKRIAMPKTWPVPRKISKRVTRPNPGGHSFERGMPLNIIIKDLLQHAETTKDVKNMLKNKEIMADGKAAKSYKQIIGLMDEIEIPKTGELFRIIIDTKGKLALIAAKKEEAGMKLCKITGKKLLGGTVQLSLHDGRTMLLDKKETGYKIGDSVLLKVPEQKIQQHLKMEKSCAIYLTGGSHIGQSGTLQEINADKIKVKSRDTTFETLKKFAFVVGKTNPEINLER